MCAGSRHARARSAGVPETGTTVSSGAHSRSSERHCWTREAGHTTSADLIRSRKQSIRSAAAACTVLPKPMSSASSTSRRFSSVSIPAHWYGGSGACHRRGPPSSVNSRGGACNTMARRRRRSSGFHGSAPAVPPAANSPRLLTGESHASNQPISWLVDGEPSISTGASLVGAPTRRRGATIRFPGVALGPLRHGIIGVVFREVGWVEFSQAACDSVERLQEKPARLQFRRQRMGAHAVRGRVVHPVPLQSRRQRWAKRRASESRARPPRGR